MARARAGSVRGLFFLHKTLPFPPYGCSTVVLICFTCPAITVVTVILWALDGVRGRALGWLGPGSPKSQPHQGYGCFYGYGCSTVVLISNPVTGAGTPLGCPHSCIGCAALCTAATGVAGRYGGTLRHQINPLRVVRATKTPHVTRRGPLGPGTAPACMEMELSPRPGPTAKSQPARIFSSLSCIKTHTRSPECHLHLCGVYV